MKKVLFMMVAVMVLAGCHTVRGIGEDIKAGGQAIEKASQ
jgi:predicted small secreted protein